MELLAVRLVKLLRAENIPAIEIAESSFNSDVIVEMTPHFFAASVN